MHHACTRSVQLLTMPVIVPQRRDGVLGVKPVHVEQHQEAVLGGLHEEDVEAGEVGQTLDGGVDGL